MKKIALAVLAFLAFALPRAAHAGMATYEVLQATGTCFGMTISSHIPTNVITSTDNAYTWVSVESEVLTSTEVIRCAERSNVSNSTTATNRGKKVKQDQTVTWILTTLMNWYCINNGGVGNVPAVVCRGR